MYAITCRACGERIDGESALDGRQFFVHPECKARSDAHNSELIALRLASPKRAEPARPIVAQADAAHLPLFVAAQEPMLF